MTNPTVTILRSLPGGGKSTLARTLVEQGAAHASADTFEDLYFVDSEGLTQIRLEHLDPAHGASYRVAIEALQAGQNVVVDNTNLSIEEVLPYVAIAQAFRANAEIVTIDTDPEVAFGRQTHGVPFAVIRNSETGDVRKTYTFGDDTTGENEAVVGGFGTMVDTFKAFAAPFHWGFLPWLTQRTA